MEYGVPVKPSGRRRVAEERRVRAQQIVDGATAGGREYLTDEEAAEFRWLVGDVDPCAPVVEPPRARLSLADAGRIHAATPPVPPAPSTPDDPDDDDEPPVAAVFHWVDYGGGVVQRVAGAPRDGVYRGHH